MASIFKISSVLGFFPPFGLVYNQFICAVKYLVSSIIEAYISQILNIRHKLQGFCRLGNI